MSTVKVVDWIDYDNDNEEAPVGGMGGWFNANNIHDKENPTAMVWEDYLAAHAQEAHPYLEALRTEILKNDLRLTGEDHQRGNVPLFSDGTVGEFSYRAWGDLMAAVYSTKENPINYMAYYM